MQALRSEAICNLDFVESKLRESKHKNNREKKPTPKYFEHQNNLS